MVIELPRCAVCRTRIEPGQNVVFRKDGRAQHTVCPEVTCPVCGRLIRPQDPIRRAEGDRLVHANCWLKTHRRGTQA